MVSKKYRLPAGGVLLILLGLGFWAANWYDAKPQSIHQVACPNLRQACQFVIGNETYVIRADQAISTNKPFQVLLSAKAERVRGRWEMTGMAMGPNEYRFQSADSLNWQARMALPLCTEARHDWLLVLEIDQSTVQIKTSSKIN
ncbi:hypothetical protein [Chitinibacter sp. GC72]|uniref:hypothetical protein n=1 Tax=Chitinibacter sp. GC72 TaxID=1526917 RepID=UPI0012F790A6|nr:hypothetical protein [Chitinibacter sp. GC72]